MGYRGQVLGGKRAGRAEEGEGEGRGETRAPFLRARLHRGGDSVSLGTLPQWRLLQPQPRGLPLHLSSQPHRAPLRDQHRPLRLR